MLLMVTACVHTRDAETEHTAHRFEYARIQMGVNARLVLYAADEPTAAAAARAAFDTIERIEQSLSDYRSESEINNLHGSAVGEWVPISDDLAGALRDAKLVWRRTDGAFDITIGPVVGLWREAGKTRTRPDPARLALARARTGFQHVEHTESPSRIRFLVDDIRLDFGGLGKGLAAQAALDTLAGQGITHALVDLGGDLALGDPPPGQAGWRIEIRTGLEVRRSVTLANTCIATSGVAEQSSIIDGVRYAHIIDPRTGEPLTTPRAATVIHPMGSVADALASAACVEGRAGLDELRLAFPEAAIHLVESEPPEPRD